jgi:integrase
LQKNGTLISKGTIENYKAALNNLILFNIYSKKEWEFTVNYKPNKSNFENEKRNYNNFYLQFTNFLYRKGCVDNYVGMHIKILRTFFIYQIHSKGYQMGIFYKNFYTRKEEIPVIVLNQVQLKYLIHDKVFESTLPKHIKQSKDIFVVGCTIGLRFSDLMNLRNRHFEKNNDAVYIVTKSNNTNTYTRIKLPIYVLDILDKYKGKQNYSWQELSLL